MKNENIFEVSVEESKAVTITEKKLIELMGEATVKAINSTLEQAKREGKTPVGLTTMYALIGADISHELRKILFGDSDT